MDCSNLRAAYDGFVSTAGSGRFDPPPAGQWAAEEILAHVMVTDRGIASLALAIASGQRATYDNRYSLDRWNLARVIATSGDRTALIDQVRHGGEQLCTIAADLSAADAEVSFHCLIISGAELVVDGPTTLGDFVRSVGTIHLPRHADQLASLRRE